MQNTPHSVHIMLCHMVGIASIAFSHKRKFTFYYTYSKKNMLPTIFADTQLYHIMVIFLYLWCNIAFYICTYSYTEHVHDIMEYNIISKYIKDTQIVFRYVCSSGICFYNPLSQSTLLWFSMFNVRSQWYKDWMKYVILKSLSAIKSESCILSFYCPHMALGQKIEKN